MKQIKLLIAVLAVVLSASAAFSQHAKFANTLFSYVSGDKTNPTSYRLTPGGTCQGDQTLCSIRVANNGSTSNLLPDDAALDQLVFDSQQLTVKGNYSTGIVYFKR